MMAPGCCSIAQSMSFLPRFTSKERDAETGLDYFGVRYFSGAQGRFTALDPTMESVLLVNPQTWNRYTYVLNNPLAFVDADGELWISTGDTKNPYSWVDKCGKGQTCYTSTAAVVGDQLRVYGDRDVADVNNYGKNSMVDLKELAANSSSKFGVAKTDQRFLSLNAARDLFLAARDFNKNTGFELLITSAALSDGRQRGHKEHAEGFEGLDFRYIGVTGQSIRNEFAALVVAPSAKVSSAAFDTFENHGFDRQISAVPPLFGTHHPGDSNIKMRVNHLNHAHVSRRIKPPNK